jgi:hypothetical protein
MQALLTFQIRTALKVRGPVRRLASLLAAGLLATLTGWAYAAPSVEVRTSDVDLFFRIYDAAGGEPTGEALQTGYIDAGSEAVRQFVPHRIRSGNDLAAAITENRGVYDHARDCLSVLPTVKAKLAGAFQRLAEIDPDATFPPVTILIGGNNSGGTTGKSGVLIGLEVMCSAASMRTDLTERLYHTIAHEYGHIEQFPHDGDGAQRPTLLHQSLVEGGAEFIAELISGEVSNVHLQLWTRGREREIDGAFLAEQDSTDVSHWLYNGLGTPEQPGDLGYWIGYRICKAYYLKASDKRLALKTLLELTDAKAILADSGWKPGDAY